MSKKNKILVLGLSAVFFTAVLAQAAKKKPKNPRRDKNKISQPAKTAERPSPPKTGLASGRWAPQVKAALEKMVIDYGKNDAAYNPRLPPIAVLPWDKTFMLNDLGDAVFQRLVTRVEFKFDEEFWEIIPIGFGRQRTQAAYQQFTAHPQRTWDQQPTYQQYRKFFITGYKQMCDKVGRKECRSYLAKLMRGFSEDEMLAYAKAVIKEEASRPMGQDLINESSEDAEAVWVSRGLRLVPEMLDLARLLLDSGFEVWISDVEPQPVLQAAIESCGLGLARAAGIQQSPLRGKLSGKVLEPIPIRGGKTEAIISQTGREPVFVLGGSADDMDLMSYGGGLRVWLNRGDEGQADLALKKGWLIQASFISE